jgi:hypothetical protein
MATVRTHVACVFDKLERDRVMAMVVVSAIGLASASLECAER